MNGKEVTFLACIAKKKKRKYVTATTSSGKNKETMMIQIN